MRWLKQKQAAIVRNTGQPLNVQTYDVKLLNGDKWPNQTTARSKVPASFMCSPFQVRFLASLPKNRAADPILKR